MFKNVVAFSTQAHKGKKVKIPKTFEFAAHSYIVAIMVNEFKHVAHTYPIVFLKGADERFGAYALLGVKHDQNLFVDTAGNWNADYIPAMIRRYPFSLGQGSDATQFVICIDEGSNLISQTEGEELVTKDGKPGRVVDQAKEFLGELYRFNELTVQFCQELYDLGILVPLTVNVKGQDGAGTTQVSGCYAVQEKKLDELTDEKFLELRKKGALPLIYAHLNSLTHVEKIIKMYQDQIV